MQKKYRLGGRRTFSYIYRKGKRTGGNYVAITYCPAKYGLRVGAVSGKRVGKSVVRNKVKRRIKDIAMHLITYMQAGYNYIIVAKSGSAEISYKDLAADIYTALSKAKLIKDETGALKWLKSRGVEYTPKAIDNRGDISDDKKGGVLC